MSITRLAVALYFASILAQTAYSAPCPEEERNTDITLPQGISVQIAERAIILYDAQGKTMCEDHAIGLNNGKIPFGMSDSPSAKPFSYLHKMVLKIGGKSYKLETNNMYNAWGNRAMDYNAKSAHKAGTHMAAHCYDKDNCTLRGIFSDGDGSYVAEWQVRNGMAIRTVLTDSNDLVHAFIGGGIKPPVF